MLKSKPAQSVICLFLALCIIITLAGCSGSADEKKSQQPTVSNTGLSVQSNSSVTSSDAEKIITQALASQSIILPSGKVWDGLAWKGLAVQFSAVGLAAGAPLTSIIGNHADVVSQEDVTINNSIPATLILVDRSQSAAEEAQTGTNTHTSEYWLIQKQLRPYPGRADMKLAYALVASFPVSASDARSHFLAFADGWKTT